MNQNPEVIKKYYTYQDEYGSGVTDTFCSENILKILTKYSYESWIRFIGLLANKLSVSNELSVIYDIQLEILNIPNSSDVVIFHKQAINACFQFICSVPPNEYCTVNYIDKRDILHVFLLINQTLELHETSKRQQSTVKHLLFGNIRTIQFTWDRIELRATMHWFQQFYHKIIELEDTSYNEIIQQIFGISISALTKLLVKRTSEEMFHFFNQFAVINYSELNDAWNTKSSRTNTPVDFVFMKKHPLIKIGDDLILTDFNNLIELSFRLIYEILFESFPQKFKPNFGKYIVEPVIIKTLHNLFIVNSARELRVTAKDYEYADYGLITGSEIYLFEIKTTSLNYSTIYETGAEIFFKDLNKRFVLKEGLMQQIKKIKRINDEPDQFFAIAQLDKNTKYRIHPVLIVFEETLQAFGLNMYFSSRFEILKRICHLSPTRVEVSPHITITFNELYQLTEIDYPNKLEYLDNFSNHKVPEGFSFFLQRLGPKYKDPKNMA